jgi:hypothetical protein
LPLMTSLDGVGQVLIMTLIATDDLP